MSKVSESLGAPGGFGLVSPYLDRPCPKSRLPVC